MLTRDHTVIPATLTFIHLWNEPSCLYSPAAEHHPTLARTHFRPTKGRRLSSTQPFTLSGMVNEYWPKCGDALRLGSKGRMAHSIGE